MNKKEIIIPFVAIGLGLAFAFISVAVFMSNGKSKKWIARKMRIGGLLLTLNAFTPGMAQEVQAKCYEQVMENIMALQNNKNSLVFKKNSEMIVKAYIDYGTYKDYSYRLIDEKNNRIQAGKIEASDGKFDYDKENFEIVLDKNLKTGKYYLLFFEGNIESQDLSIFRNRIQIDIKDE